MHGLFDNKCVVEHILAPFIPDFTLHKDYTQTKEENLNQLAKQVRKHLDIKSIIETMQEKDSY